MGDLSTAVLLEQFDKHMEVLGGRIENMKGISATLESTPPLPRTKPIGLFDIPLETRLRVYNYCIPRKRIVEVSGPRFHVRWPAKEDDDTQEFEGEDNSWDVEEEDNSLDFGSVASDSVIDHWKISENRKSLLLVSKQIGEEALDLLYGENIFKLHLHGEGEYFLRKNFSGRNRRRMRYTLVIAQPMGVSFKPGRKPDNALWSSTLPNLKILRLIHSNPSQLRVITTPPRSCNGWIDGSNGSSPSWNALVNICGAHLLLRSTIMIRKRQVNLLRNVYGIIIGRYGVISLAV